MIYACRSWGKNNSWFKRGGGGGGGGGCPPNYVPPKFLTRQYALVIHALSNPSLASLYLCPVLPQTVLYTYVPLG